MRRMIGSSTVKAGPDGPRMPGNCAVAAAGTSNSAAARIDAQRLTHDLLAYRMADLEAPATAGQRRYGWAPESVAPGVVAARRSGGDAWRRRYAAALAAVRG